MALYVAQDIINLSLILTGSMLIITLIVFILAFSFRSRRVSTEGVEMYIGGESEEILRYKLPSVLALYWGIVKRAWRKAFDVLREAVHTGILNDWLGYMSIWLGLVLLVAIISVIAYVFFAHG
ncbi:MAG: sodium:proton antiporter [Ignisphaera sp.]|uniref:Sodium:proton antiporter n=1 Tax=Ignisphaera aggregans TaxID=334771 RepID=A0A7C4JJY2_9CREN